MSYIKVGWKHRHVDEPVILYSELDEKRFEVRKVEVLRDGRFWWASAQTTSGGARLGTEAVPELSEIARDPEFDPVAITREEFETIWARRQG